MKWTTVDKDYRLSRCSARVVGDDLEIKMSGYHQKGLKQVISGFKSMTALDALKEHGITSGDSYWGRHYEDCVFHVYHDLGLDLGYIDFKLKELS